MPPRLFRYHSRTADVILIDAATLRESEKLIESCEANPEDAQIPFDNVFDRVTGSRSERDGLHS
jgi:hypothetical protein